MPPVVIDTNILLRSADPNHAMYQTAVDAVELLRRRGDRPCLFPQNLIEFRAVCTRPLSVNGLGMSEAEIKIEIVRLKSLFPLFNDVPAILAEWERLVDTYGAVGRQNHDARIVAAMLVHSIAHILTFDKSDFVRYPEITILTPNEILSGT